jgi:Predicted integral membrane protein
MSIFSPDSKFMLFMGRLADVLFLNLLWLVCCLPLVTVGASTVAACYVTQKMVDEEEFHIARTFFKAFKENFRRGTILWLLNAAALYALYLDWQIVTKSSAPSVPLILVSILSAVFVFCAFIYSYPLLARYENTLKRTMENSIRICFRYFGKTAILIVVLLLEIGLFSWDEVMLVIGALVGPMILIYTVSGVSKRIFQQIDKDNGTRGEIDSKP